jgi:hypothetical protein
MRFGSQNLSIQSHSPHFASPGLPEEIRQAFPFTSRTSPTLQTARIASLPTPKNSQTVTGYERHHFMITLSPQMRFIRQS